MKKILVLVNSLGECIAAFKEKDELSIAKAITESQGAEETFLQITENGEGAEDVHATVFREGSKEFQYFSLQWVDFYGTQEG